MNKQEFYLKSNPPRPTFMVDMMPEEMTRQATDTPELEILALISYINFPLKAL